MIYINIKRYYYKKLKFNYVKINKITIYQQVNLTKQQN